jgi:hypothetical protein
MRRIVLFMLLISPSIPLKAGTLYFADVIDGGGYVTTFTIVNPTTSTATGTLKLREDNGSPWIISFLGRTNSSQFSISIPPMGTVRLISSGAGFSTEVGWAVLDSQADLQAVERFDYRPGTVLEDSVSLNGTPSAKRFILPVDTFGTWDTGFDTGFAIANVGTTNANIELSLLDEDGNTYMSTVYPPLTPLAANRQIAVFATEVFPVLQSGLFRGLLEIEVSGGVGDIAVVGLSFKEGQFSIVPAIPMLWEPKEQASVTLVASPSYGGTASGGGSYPVGSSVSVSAVPTADWIFSRWSDGSTEAQRRVTVVKGGVSLTAYFRPGINSVTHPWRDMYDAVDDVLQSEGISAAVDYIVEIVRIGDYERSSSDTLYLVTDVDVKANGSWVVGDGRGPSNYSAYYWYNSSGIRVLELYLGH